MRRDRAAIAHEVCARSARPRARGDGAIWHVPQVRLRCLRSSRHDRAGRRTTARLSNTTASAGRPGPLDDPNGSDAIAISQTWSDSSHIVARTDPNGNTTRYMHDAAENVAAIQIRTERRKHRRSTREEIVSAGPMRTARPWSTGMTCWTGSWGARSHPAPGSRTIRRPSPISYDELGRLIRATNNLHTVERSYDALSRVVTETQDGRAITNDLPARHARRHQLPLGLPARVRLSGCGSPADS